MIQNEETIFHEFRAASKAWINNFNQGNIEECVAAYAEDAVMNAKPMGTFRGRSAIEKFWRPFIESGAGELVYKNVEVEIVDERTVELSAEWSMNVGRGIITLERWVKNETGMWCLVRDDFEIYEKF